MLTIKAKEEITGFGRVEGRTRADVVESWLKSKAASPEKGPKRALFMCALPDVHEVTAQPTDMELWWRPAYALAGSNVRAKEPR